jgi:predicted RNA binding protein YcfA (HicA-like mRNA interferase family)
MGNWKKTLAKVMSGTADANIRYDDLCHLLRRLGYSNRQSGSHNVFRHPGRDLLNLQKAGGMAKAYQVTQVREQLKKSLS